jgi:iron-sulfur cluster repair protein YtfE (RIC family)
MIRRDMLVEELVEEWPGAVSYLLRRGITVIACGAPVWGTLEEAARSGGCDADELDAMVAEMRRLQAEQASKTGG